MMPIFRKLSCKYLWECIVALQPGKEFMRQYHREFPHRASSKTNMVCFFLWGFFYLFLGYRDCMIFFWPPNKCITILKYIIPQLKKFSIYVYNSSGWFYMKRFHFMPSHTHTPGFSSLGPSFFVHRNIHHVKWNLNHHPTININIVKCHQFHMYISKNGENTQHYQG